MVVAHEVGHTLGLEHSPARSALMSPYYKKLSKDFVLSWDDILAIQNLYGEHRFPKTSMGREEQDGSRSVHGVRALCVVGMGPVPSQVLQGGQDGYWMIQGEASA